jgi:restriction endonuclease S subunit
MFQTVELNEKLNLIKKGSTSIWAVYQKDLNKISIKLPDIETQQKIVDELDAKSQILEGLRKMKTEAQNKINQILADVWGVEFIEPEKELVEDEQEN